MSKVTVLNSHIESGWALRARALGMKVTSAPGKFGDEVFLVKRDGDAVQLRQNTQARRLLDITGFTGKQIAIIEDLKKCGLIAA
ncbi:hypothetical protein [Herbaspirillum huttiense]|uniref:hypothetical protein n=1 Tax=Herbaspirillum huttiense TaxID=863372 RepID=UPI003E7B7454